ncbi:MAG TPA: TolC family outer membrane protein [Steroidobacteraceae bacterium]|nr:TolC family outer membrane protein [Steroidobacteraceae bacterium]
MRVRVLFCSTILGLGLTAAAPAADLMAIYQQALQADPSIREADANRLAARESRPQAWAALLPQINGFGQYNRDKPDGSFTNIDPNTGLYVPSQSRSDTKTKYWQLQLQQTVFQWEQWVALKRSSSELAQAEADYKAAQQGLMLRVATRYFDVLAAEDNLRAQEAATEAVTRQLEQAEKRFEVGLIAVTDVQEAKAAHDTGTADVIAAKRSLATTQEFLREITGQPTPALARPGEDLPLLPPSPADQESWVETSMKQNLALTSSHLASDIAHDNVRVAFGGHLPSVSLGVTRSNTDITGTHTVDGLASPADSNFDDNLLQLQVTVPIFSSGATQSKVRQAEYRYQAANQRYVRTSRETERAARDAYLGVLSEMSRVQALRQAFESSRTALKATEAGYEVGTRTAVDVLLSRRTLVQAATTYLRSRYDYLLNVIQLKIAAGNLNEEDLKEINSWFKEQTPEQSLPQDTSKDTSKDAPK